MKALLASLCCLSSVVFTQAQPLPAISPGGPAALPGGATTPAPGADSEYAVVARGANHRVWARVTYTTNRLGRVLSRTHSFTEVATGLHFKRNDQGDWLETSEKIAILPGGQMAAATNGPHQVYFPADLYTGAIEVVTPDGKHLLSRPSGLSYFDGTNNVLIAEITNSVGQVLPSGNQVIWTNCFTGIQADIIATYRKSGVECDLVFRSAPPAPEEYGLGACWVQLWTEFFDSPQPVEKMARAVGPDGLSDVTLDFGALKMVQGRAFSAESRSAPTTGGALNSGASAAPSQKGQPGMPVYKTWGQFDGRSFLIEEVPYARIESQLKGLTAANTTGSRSKERQSLFASRASSRYAAGVKLGQVAPGRDLSQSRATARPSSLPLLTPFRPVQHSTNAILLARADFKASPGFVLDYAEVVGATNEYTFSSDQTYFVSDEFYVDGTATLEGGTVIKFRDGNYWSGVHCDQVACHTGPYRIATLTSEDDNTVGETLPWSSGRPYLCEYFLVPTSAPYIKHLRAAYACYAVWCYDSSAVEVSDCQFVNCSQPLIFSANVNVHNDLFVGCYCAVANWYGSLTVRGEHVTAHNCQMFTGTSGGSVSAYLTNSLFTALGTTLPSPANSEPTVVVLSSSDGVYQTVGAGSYYLADNSPYRNAGTTNIDPAVLAGLRQKTTSPPIVLPSAIAVDTVLGPQAQRDTDAPDLGYHYTPVDYIASNVTLTASLTLTNGVAIGLCGYYGFLFPAGESEDSERMASMGGASATLDDSSSAVAAFTSVGLPTRLNTLVPAWNVQEQPLGDWFFPGLFWLQNSTAPAIDLRFTQIPLARGRLGDFQEARLDNGDWVFGSLRLRDCVLSGVDLFAFAYPDYYPTSATLTNNLLDRCSLCFEIFNLGLRNNLFRAGSLALLPQYGSYTWDIRDNLFDLCTNSLYCAYGNDYVLRDHNGFTTNTVNNLRGSQNKSNLVADYQTGPIGMYYYPTNGGAYTLTNLINAGSTWATNVGLYHFTTTTNQVKEAGTKVDIGYHYVALDANGNPVDTDGDGNPDYLEDVDGDGAYNSAVDLSNWQAADTDGDGVNDGLELLQGRNPKIAGTVDDTSGVIKLQVYTPLK